MPNETIDKIISLVDRLKETESWEGNPENYEANYGDEYQRYHLQMEIVSYSNIKIKGPWYDENLKPQKPEKYLIEVNDGLYVVGELDQYGDPANAHVQEYDSEQDGLVINSYYNQFDEQLTRFAELVFEGEK